MATSKRGTRKQSARTKSTRTKSTRKASASSASTRKKSAGKQAARKKSKTAKRTLIAPKGDKRYVRRNTRGRFKESDDVSRSLSSDRRKRAKRKAPRGQGDKGD